MHEFMILSTRISWCCHVRDVKVGEGREDEIRSRREELTTTRHAKDLSRKVDNSYRQWRQSSNTRHMIHKTSVILR